MRQSHRLCVCLSAFVLLALISTAHAADIKKADLLGCWQRTDENPDEMMRFEESRFINVGKDYREIMPLIYENGKVTLTPNGDKQEMKVELKDGLLTVTQPDHKEIYKKLTNVPPELDFSPLKLGASKDLPADKVKSIQDELAKRVVEDQAVRKDPNRRNDMQAVDADDTAWLRKLVLEIGWIDANRFGKATANSAFLIVQHSGDLRLMQGALPEIEKDFRAGIADPQDYALLYDRLKLNLGERQRYGSQIGANAKGEQIVLPLEDKSKVEQFRKEIGLFPLAAYLQIFKQRTGKDVKFAE